MRKFLTRGVTSFWRNSLLHGVIVLVIDDDDDDDDDDYEDGDDNDMIEVPSVSHLEVWTILIQIQLPYDRCT
jgi:hypothetical protein